MAYTFLDASLPIRKNPKDSMSSDFLQSLSIDFRTSTDWFTIEKEITYGSKTFENIVVRVTKLFDGKTTVSVGNDYKRIMFSNSSYIPKLGSLFRFDDNYWIVTNAETIKALAPTCVVRRCNNMLKWKDDNTGQIYEEPCVIDYLIKESRDYSTGGSTIVQPSGFIDVITQYNERSNKIKPSKRFLFGNPDNWMGYKIMGGGLNNFDRQLTSDSRSGGLLRLSMLANQWNKTTDDLVNGIADVGEYTYRLDLNTNSISMSTGNTYKLVPSYSINGSNTLSVSYVWNSSNEAVATVDSNGIVTAISSGSVLITCSSSDNSDAHDSCNITVTSVPTSNNSIIVNPNRGYIYEGESQVYDVRLYLDGIAQLDTFTFSLNNNSIPSSKYSYSVIDGNSFVITNIERHSGNEQLSITAKSGLNETVINIRLNGAW